MQDAAKPSSLTIFGRGLLVGKISQEHGRNKGGQCKVNAVLVELM